MLGAIIGDIVGSVYEWHNLKSVDFELLTPQNFFTDDSVMTVATARALMGDRDFGRHYRELGLRYPDRGYGCMFKDWLNGHIHGPYNSFGNGSAMRVSPVAYAARTLQEALELAKASAEVTHSHPEGIEGAQAVAAAIFWARTGMKADAIAAELERRHSYNFRKPVEEIRRTNRFDETCAGTLPVVLACVFQSTSFEDCLRLAVSCGGDSDTIAAIAGSIAEPLFGIPEALESRIHSYLPAELLGEVRKFRDRFMQKLPRPSYTTFKERADELAPYLLESRWFSMTYMLIPGVLAKVDTLIEEMSRYEEPDDGAYVAELLGKLKVLRGQFKRIR